MEQNEATISKKGYSKEEKQELIASWQRSGKSRVAFSKEVGINYHTLIQPGTDCVQGDFFYYRFVYVRVFLP